MQLKRTIRRSLSLQRVGNGRSSRLGSILHLSEKPSSEVNPSSAVNIIATNGIVSTEYILSKIKQVQANTDATTLELEDFVLRLQDKYGSVTDEDILLATKNLLARGDGNSSSGLVTPWEFIRFIDQIRIHNCHELSHYVAQQEALRCKIFPEQASTEIEEKPGVIFQVKLEIQSGTSINTICGLISAVLQLDLARVEFGGSLFGIERAELAKHLASLCCIRSSQGGGREKSGGDDHDTIVIGKMILMNLVWGEPGVVPRNFNVAKVILKRCVLELNHLRSNHPCRVSKDVLSKCNPELDDMKTSHDASNEEQPSPPPSSASKGRGKPSPSKNIRISRESRIALRRQDSHQPKFDGETQPTLQALQSQQPAQKVGQEAADPGTVPVQQCASQSLVLQQAKTTLALKHQRLTQTMQETPTKGGANVRGLRRGCLPKRHHSSPLITPKFSSPPVLAIEEKPSKSNASGNRRRCRPRRHHSARSIGTPDYDWVTNKARSEQLLCTMSPSPSTSPQRKQGRSGTSKSDLDHKSSRRASRIALRCKEAQKPASGGEAQPSLQAPPSLEGVQSLSEVGMSVEYGTMPNKVCQLQTPVLKRAVTVPTPQRQKPATCLNRTTTSESERILCKPDYRWDKQKKKKFDSALFRLVRDELEDDSKQQSFTEVTELESDDETQFDDNSSTTHCLPLDESDLKNSFDTPLCRLIVTQPESDDETKKVDNMMESSAVLETIKLLASTREVHAKQKIARTSGGEGYKWWVQ